MRPLFTSVACRVGGVLLCLVHSLGLAAATAAEFRRGPDLSAPRSGHAAALLQDGRVLVAGSTAQAAAWSSELYDPVQHRWQPGPGLAQAEAGASLTVLPTGKVLLAGQGRQLFDPATNTWSASTQGLLQRRRHSAVLMADGQVLLAGGEARFGGEIDTLEGYDAIGNSWNYWGRLNQPRQAHAAVRLVSGKVLVAGGRAGGAELSSAETFELQHYLVETTASMLAARSDFSLTLLPDGRVLAAGGSSNGVSQSSCEIYDPASGTWQWAAGMLHPRSGHAASLLPNGRLLVSGGNVAAGTAQATAEIYDPVTNQWSAASELAVARAGHTAVLLPSGSVLLAGGSGAAAALSSEWFDPALTSTQFATVPQTLRRGAITTLLPPDKVLLGGGSGLPGDDSSAAEVFDTGAGTWSWLGLVAGRTRHTQTLLGNGKVLLAGGLYSGAPTAHCELADGLTATSAATAFLLTPRYAHSATLLADGGVLAAGGYASGAAPTAAVEYYRSGAGAWLPRAALNTARAGHTATLLGDGRVLVSGGRGAGGQLLDSAEIYDPAADSWTAAAAPGIARESATATLLRSGEVFVLGGVDSADQPLARADLYDPRTGSWRQAATPLRGRVQHTMTVLPGGQVLVAGGRTGASGGSDAVEIYTPEFNNWSSAAPLMSPRAGHVAIPLPSGQLVFAQGYADNWAPLVERYETGIAPDPARQPRLYSASLPAGGQGSLHVRGSGFRPAASADGGGGAGASSNLPVLQVQRVDNGQTRFVAADPASIFTDNLFSGRAADLADFPAGPVQLRIWVNGIPGTPLLATLASVPAMAAAPVAQGGVLRAAATFAPATDDGGAPISGYRVTAAPGGAVRSCLAPCSQVEFEALPPGSYSFRVSAVNAAGAAAPSPPSNSVTVQARSSVALGSSANPSRFAAAVTFTAAVSGLAPGGTATFRADGSALCSAVALTTGIAECTTAALGGGLHAIDVNYSGDAGNTAAQSATLYQQVDSAASQAALASSANPATYGERVVLTATITTTRLAGEVDFHDGTAPLCLDVPLSGGTAVCEVDNFSVGTHAVTARYGGDGDTGASVSFALAQQVLALPTTTSVTTSCQRRFTANQPFTLSAAISAQALGGIPGGGVDFVTESGITLCQAVPLNSATASCTSTGLAPPAGQGEGVVAISARYSGDAVNAGGSSPELQVTVFDAADVILRNGFEAAVPGCPAH
ncbi:kelch repeat-containing protein [Tahibacter harae]|uniref:Ig-like domain repeat protein n=1 Tax=Tahibacter harae TaxID=2963937 RepID=A0ABT1QVN1_9GAMM|nr:kelch repeat-containing protein [Tahibacter harae]MCQ4166342.1 Ig-like domain repeat protein [Tahibacter harae]